MLNISILYICTGKYSMFWRDFYESTQKYFLPNSNYELHYFVFTDELSLPYEDKPYVNKIYQVALEWPYITLLRFEIFKKCFNGGVASEYMAMIDELEMRVRKDLNNDIIAVYHDESHLNKYATEHLNEIKILSPSYGYIEGMGLPFPQKIIMLNKNKFGGHTFMRNQINLPFVNDTEIKVKSYNIMSRLQSVLTIVRTKLNI